MEILQAMYPTLQKVLRYHLEITDGRNIDYDDNSIHTTKTIFHCSSRKSTSPTPELVMHWQPDRGYPITRHSFTFRASSAWIDERAEDLNVLVEIGAERVLAFAMGFHKRLGERSNIKNFNSDLLGCIGKIIIKNF